MLVLVLRSIAWWGWNWLFLLPMAFFGTAGIWIVTGSWKIWLGFFIFGTIYEALLPIRDVER